MQMERRRKRKAAIVCTTTVEPEVAIKLTLGEEAAEGETEPLIMEANSVLL